jgi:formylglycine-generating enzyme required for sulfatase activity
VAGHIFFSYSRIDEPVMRPVFNRLAEMGYDCWLDVERIPSGSDWDAELERAIKDCSHFIVMCTPTSMSSKNVQAEWQYAFDLKKSIHPVIIIPVDLPFRLRIYQHVDVTKLGLETAIAKLVETLPRRADYELIEGGSVTGESESSKVRGLINRSVQNWRTFGLLLDKDAFKYVNDHRSALTDLDSSTLEFIYLSLRHLQHSVETDIIQYWATRVKEHDFASDAVENVIVDEIGTTFLYELQAELEVFASARLLSKVAKLIAINESEDDEDLLLTASIRLLTKADHNNAEISELEAILFEKFIEQPNRTIARALGWINSPKLLEDISSKLKNPGVRVFGDFDPFHLIALVNMQNRQAMNILEQVTPDGFIHIPAGWFVMGSELAQESLGSPPHDVFVPSFWIRLIPVTELEYRQHTFLPINEVRTEYPAHNVSWNMAVQWLSVVGRLLNLPIRLPSEAMWEKAASWDPKQMRKLKFPWGDEVDPSRCNTVESKRARFTPVSHFSPKGDSPYGAQDMVGNVWEWTSSPWKSYPYQSQVERSTISGLKVMRGPSHDASRGLSQGCSTRIAFDEAYFFENAGFRGAVVVDL